MYQRVIRAFGPRLLHHSNHAVALANQLIPLDGNVFSAVLVAVILQPLELFCAGIVIQLWRRLVAHCDSQVLLLLKRQRLERPKNTVLVHNLQLPRHILIVTVSRGYFSRTKSIVPVNSRP